MKELATARRGGPGHVRTTLRTRSGKVIDITGDADNPYQVAQSMWTRIARRVIGPRALRAKIVEDLLRRGHDARRFHA